MYAKFKNYLWNLTLREAPMGPPTTRNKADLNFSIL